MSEQIYANTLLHDDIATVFRYRRYYSDSTFDEYHAKHNLSAMENLFAGYVNARLDKYLKILQN